MWVQAGGGAEGLGWALQRLQVPAPGGRAPDGCMATGAGARKWWWGAGGGCRWVQGPWGQEQAGTDRTRGSGRGRGCWEGQRQRTGGAERGRGKGGEVLGGGQPPPAGLAAAGSPPLPRPARMPTCRCPPGSCSGCRRTSGRPAAPQPPAPWWCRGAALKAGRAGQRGARREAWGVIAVSACGAAPTRAPQA